MMSPNTSRGGGERGGSGNLPPAPVPTVGHRPNNGRMKALPISQTAAPEHPPPPPPHPTAAPGVVKMLPPTPLQQGAPKHPPHTPRTQPCPPPRATEGLVPTLPIGDPPHMHGLHLGPILLSTTPTILPDPPPCTPQLYTSAASGRCGGGGLVPPILPTIRRGGANQAAGQSWVPAVAMPGGGGGEGCPQDGNRQEGNDTAPGRTVK